MAAKEPTKRKIIIVSGQRREEIEIDGDAKKVTIFVIGSDANPARAEEFAEFQKHLIMALKDPNYIILWNHRVRVLQPEL